MKGINANDDHLTNSTENWTTLRATFLVNSEPGSRYESAVFNYFTKSGFANSSTLT